MAPTSHPLGPQHLAGSCRPGAQRPSSFHITDRTLPLLDMECYGVMLQLPRCFEFIDQAISEGGEPGPPPPFSHRHMQATIMFRPSAPLSSSPPLRTLTPEPAHGPWSLEYGAQVMWRNYAPPTALGGRARPTQIQCAPRHVCVRVRWVFTDVVLLSIRYMASLRPHTEHAAIGVWHGCHADGAGGGEHDALLHIVQHIETRGWHGAVTVHANSLAHVTGACMYARGSRRLRPAAYVQPMTTSICMMVLVRVTYEFSRSIVCAWYL
jgi:hypothetical protein